MTSPYLNKPSRSIKKALDDRGMTANDIGLDEAVFNSPHKGNAKNYLFLGVAFACLVILLGAAGVVNTLSRSHNNEILTAEEVESLSGDMENITPAAGK